MHGFDNLVQVATVIGAAVATLAGAISIAYTRKRPGRDSDTPSNRGPIYRRAKLRRRGRARPWAGVATPATMVGSLVVSYRGAPGDLSFVVPLGHENGFENWIADMAVEAMNQDPSDVIGALFLAEYDGFGDAHPVLSVGLCTDIALHVFEELRAYEALYVHSDPETRQSSDWIDPSDETDDPFEDDDLEV